MASSLLRLRGLPFSSTVDDIRDFFSDYKVEEAVLLLKNAKPTGEAYVQLSSPEEAQKALKERQHEHMGPRYIEIFEAVEADLVARSLSGGEAGPSLSGHVVRLRGLPFTSTAHDVLELFSGLEVVGGEAGVLFTCTPDGRPTGEAYLELASEDDLAGALARHKEKIGARYIEIFQSGKGDMYQAVQQHGFFTAVGGRRKHHWHAQHGGMGGHGGEMGGRGDRKQQANMDEMNAAFAGFGLSQRDMQVPGPPRYGYVYGSSPDERHFVGRPQLPPPPTGIAAPSWRQATVQQAHGMRMRPQMQQQFNPAPGPPVKPGSRSSMAGAGGGMYEYAAQPTAIMVNPFMMQHPFVMGQQQGSAWGGAMMPAQAGGAWYGGMAGGRGGMQMGQMAAGPYYTPAGGYYTTAATGGMQRGMAPQSMAPGQPVSSSQYSGSRSAYASTTTSQPVPPPPMPPPLPSDSRRGPKPASLESAGANSQSLGNGVGRAGSEAHEAAQQHDSAASSPPLRPLSARSSPMKLLEEPEPEVQALGEAAQQLEQ